MGQANERQTRWEDWKGNDLWADTVEQKFRIFLGEIFILRWDALNLNVGQLKSFVEAKLKCWFRGDLRGKFMDPKAIEQFYNL